MTDRPAYYPYLPYIILYFFLNNAMLPQGLLFTTLLSPVFLYWIYKQDRLREMILWSVVFIIPVPFQLAGGVDTHSYVISTVLVVTAWIFFYTALRFSSIMSSGIYKVFRTVLIINSALVAIALLFLPFSSLRGLLWDSTPISPNIPPFPRLNLLAYEPSHYALLLTPVFLYFFLMAITGKLKHPLLFMIAVFTPLLLSLSFGVMAAFIISAATVLVVYFYRYPPRSRRSFIYVLLTVLLALVALQLLFPSNPLGARVVNIFTGADTSARGRLLNSFMFASDLIAKHNVGFGVGPGQVKILAHDLIINYYQYTGDFAEVVRIPNSMAEVLAIYGVYGAVLKVVLAIYFFIRTRVYSNLFALALFTFIFVYQFTGSFLVNVAELGIWAMVFACRPQELQIINPNPRIS